MQIAQCWFDLSAHKVVDQQSQIDWQLQPDEYHILCLLAAQKDKVVSRLELLQLTQQYQRDDLAPEARLNDIMYRLKRFLNRPHEVLGDVADQGYILYTKPIAAKGGLLQSPIKSFSMVQFVLLNLLTALALYWMSLCISHPTQIAPNYARQFVTLDGQHTQVSVYSERLKDRPIQPLAEHMMGLLATCPVLPWESISASVSQDTNVLSLVLKTTQNEEVIFKVIKLMSAELKEVRLDIPWLQAVGICAE